MTFLELYGDRLDDKLGTTDRTQRFTTVKRKQYVNDGQKKFAEQTSCYVKRHALAIVDGTQEYDIEAAATDYMWPSGTTASLKMVGASVTSYREGPELTIVTEETLNNIDPNWRAASAGTPEYVYWRDDDGSKFIGLHPTPDVPAGETWTLLLPYAARPANMTDDTHEPYGLASPRITLRPYHDAILFYATAECELLRKNREMHDYWMKRFGAEVLRYMGNSAPKTGQRIRLAIPYRQRLRGGRPLDPTRYP